MVAYGDFECPYCGRAEPAVRELLRDFADVRYVWRHLPLTDVHPHAELAALASEAAAEQGAFWKMHELLLERQDKLRMADLVSYADRLGLDVARFTEDLQGHVGANRIAQDVEGADLSRVSGTPTFFINGRRHHGAYDIDHLVARSPRRRRPRQAGGVVALTCLAGCGPSSRSGSARSRGRPHATAPRRASGDRRVEHRPGIS